MKIIDYLYINFFAASYRNGFHDKRVNPNSFASLVLGISLGGWFMSTIIFYYKIQFNIFPNSNLKYLTIFFSILCSGIINWYYLKDDRYLKLYESYKQNRKFISSGYIFFLGLFLILFPYMLSFFSSFVHK